ncbi:MAG: hypothetical protein HYZ69_04150 [Candidatus Colwellbacteria bacterium]|nr:hypothetical protein [Candidatus Colwellbacteria bacterium]
MKHLRLISALVTSFIFLVAACAQAQTDPPVLPDVSGQEVETGNLKGALNGKSVDLKVDEYSYIDWSKLERNFVQFIYNEQGKQWLAFYSKEVGEKLPNGGVRTKEVHDYLFEHINNGWVLVKEFAANQDPDSTRKDLNELLKNKYKLEYGR